MSNNRLMLGNVNCKMAAAQVYVWQGQALSRPKEKDRFWTYSSFR